MLWESQNYNTAAQQQIEGFRKPGVRIMKAADRHTRKPARFATVTDANHHCPITPNLLGQVFRANRSSAVGYLT